MSREMIQTSEAKEKSMYDEDTLKTYQRASFGGRLTLGNIPAVIVVDFSRGFTDPRSPLGADMTPAVEATRRLLDVARLKQHMVVFTTVAYDPHLKDAGLLVQKSPAVEVLQYGSHWTEIDDRLAPREDELVVVKKGPSAFFGTNMAAVLVSNRIDTVVLTGAVTSGCIRATAVDLLQHGFPTLLPRECVGDRAQGPHNANLFDMHEKYVDVVSEEDAISYLNSVDHSVSEMATTREGASTKSGDQRTD